MPIMLDMRVRDIVHAVVASEARHELRYVARLTRFDDSWVIWRLRHATPRDEALGFGIDEMTALITPIIWIAVNEAAREFGSTAGDGVFAALRALIHRILRRKPKAAVIPPLTQSQQEKVCEMVQEQLLRAKLSQGRAESIANVVFRELSRGFVPDGNTESGPPEVNEPTRG